MKINSLAIIGVGLIGGSLAMALKKVGMVDHVIGCGRGKHNLEKAVELGVIDSYTHSVAEAVQDADVVFVAVPLGAMKGVFEQMTGHLKEGAVVTDGGSAKASVINDWNSVFSDEPQQPFLVPGHPIAGTENSGVEAAFDELYQNRRVILTPLAETNDDAVKVVEQMWQACGAEVTKMSVKLHDEVLAATSHLPHMLAFGLVDTLAKMEEHNEIFRYAAGGFRDFSRIASSNPEMWRDICVANADALSDILDHFNRELAELSQLIRNGDAEKIEQIFKSAKAARDSYVDGL